MANFEVTGVSAVPAECAGGDQVQLTIVIRPYVTGYATVRCIVCEGSGVWPTPGTELWSEEKPVYFTAGELVPPVPVTFLHTAIYTGQSRRDIKVEIFDEWGMMYPLSGQQSDWDDVFYVTSGGGGTEPTFTGYFTDILLKPGSDASDVRFLVSFNAGALNAWDTFGWETQVTLTMGPYSTSDRQNHIGADGSRTNQELRLGAVPPGTYNATLRLEARGLLGSWQLLDTVTSQWKVLGPDEPPDGNGTIPPAGEFPWGMVAIAAGIGLVALSLVPSGRTSSRQH